MNYAGLCVTVLPIILRVHPSLPVGILDPTNFLYIVLNNLFFYASSILIITSGAIDSTPLTRVQQGGNQHATTFISNTYYNLCVHGFTLPHAFSAYQCFARVKVFVLRIT